MKKFYNLWRGFAVDPVAPGETVPAEWQRSVDMWIEHVEQNVCGGDKKLARWLIGYFAHMVQCPGIKPLVALVFRGDKGVGKNVAVERVGALFGSHFLVTSNRRYLVSNFNSHFENLILFVLDEASWPGDKQAEGILKDLITGTQHLIEHKGEKPYSVANLMRVIIMGNESWIAPMSHDERRFAAFNVGEGRKQDRQFFQTMREGMEAGGYRVFLRYLLDYDISGLDFNEAPVTAELRSQKEESLDVLYQWWLDCLLEGQIVGSDFGAAWPQEIETERFRSAFRRYSKDRNIRSRFPDSRAIGRLLKHCVPGMVKHRARQGDDLPYLYRLPTLDEARASWEKWIGHAVDWT